MRSIQILILSIIIIVIITSCESVKPYQRAYLNDYEMKSGQFAINKFDDQVQSYREAASGGGSSKVSGGCGCN